MYYFLNHREIIRMNEGLDLPSVIPLTEGQALFHERFPYKSVREVEYYQGDGSDLDDYEPTPLTDSRNLDQVREDAILRITKKYKYILSEKVSILDLCEALTGTVYSSRINNTILTEEEVLTTADEFIILDKTCRDRLSADYELINSATEESNIETIVCESEEYFDSLINQDGTDIESVRRNKLRQIDLYDTSETVNGFFLNGTLMWLDKSIRSGLVNTLNSATVIGRETINIWFKGIYITLPTEQAKQLLAALEIYATDCYNVTAQHKVNVNNLQTIEEINSYDITSGYPDRLEFNLG